MEQEHTHVWDKDGYCVECGMHKEEIFANLSGVLLNEREQEQEYDPLW